MTRSPPHFANSWQSDHRRNKVNTVETSHLFVDGNPVFTPTRGENGDFLEEIPFYGNTVMFPGFSFKQLWHWVVYEWCMDLKGTSLWDWYSIIVNPLALLFIVSNKNTLWTTTTVVVPRWFQTFLTHSVSLHILHRIIHLPKIIKTTYTHPSWWFQPIFKTIISSNWIIIPRDRNEQNPKIFEMPPNIISCWETETTN